MSTGVPSLAVIGVVDRWNDARPAEGSVPGLRNARGGWLRRRIGTRVRPVRVRLAPDSEGGEPMFARLTGWVAVGIEAAGILIIVSGAIVATTIFLHRLVRDRSFSRVYPSYRGNLGRAILLGLELLVAADIVGTVVVDPTFSNLGILGLIVLIRIVLSFAMDVEINGHWPWRQAELALRGSGGADGATQGARTDA